ncbi:hypothetical protein SAMN05192559_1203 [Halobacillus karajensis]|uniref:YqjF family protein n=1 Tax=Halobacillus karajensis TaxID=195088 RepID=UPI0008A78DBB|nr:DUF2071 domain-containing protein [Halobacillus karajensis]SEI14233.1 hypothetical protein SAMN05192559_1203 [Halobacillus karajensis]
MYKDIIKSTQHREYSLPDGPWLMTQKWNHLLFMHFPVSKEVIKDHIPRDLELDTYEGTAWITIIPFKVSDMRLRKMPPVPYLNSYLELNVRTYVRRNGLPGIYFFSLDADKILAVLGARLATLPYYYSKMKMKEEKENTFHYTSMRKGEPEAIFKGSYGPISEAYFPEKGSLAYWLLERYYLWSYKKGALFRGGIHHKQWKIHDAEVAIENQNLSSFLPDHFFNKRPLLHYAFSRRVLFWPIKKIK